MPRPSKLTTAQKEKIVIDARRGRPVATIAREHGLTVQYLYRILAAAPESICWWCGNGEPGSDKEARAPSQWSKDKNKEFFCSENCESLFGSQWGKDRKKLHLTLESIAVSKLLDEDSSLI